MPPPLSNNGKYRWIGIPKPLAFKTPIRECILGRILHSCFYKESPSPTEQWKKGPWLFRVNRGIYYPVMWGFYGNLRNHETRIPSLINQYFMGFFSTEPSKHQMIPFSGHGGNSAELYTMELLQLSRSSQWLSSHCQAKNGEVELGNSDWWVMQCPHGFFDFWNIPMKYPMSWIYPPPRMPVTTRIFRCLGWESF